MLLLSAGSRLNCIKGIANISVTSMESNSFGNVSPNRRKRTIFNASCRETP